jgi:hypothetical protein
MRSRAYLSFVLFLAVPAWPQVAPTATGGSNDNSQMITPPPVSGDAYSTTMESEARSNYLGFGMSVTPAYDDNLFPGNSGSQNSDFSYLIGPNLSLDRTTPRQHETLRYSPAFNLYQRNSQLDAIDQGASLRYQYRVSPQTTVVAGDTFNQTSNVFDESPIFSGTAISGSTQIPTVSAIAPFAEQRSNALSGNVSYQFSQNGMIGGGASFSTFDFPNPNQAAGLSNSRTTGGSASFSRRMTATQYVGVGYQYARSFSFLSQNQIETQTNSIAPYYTFALGKGFSFSLSGGIVRFNSTEAGTPPYAAWSPTGSASINWIRSNSALAASYSRSISSGMGLVGAYSSSVVSASESQRVTRSWSIGVVGTYSDTNNSDPLPGASGSNGSSISGSASLQRALGERFSVNFGYQRLHESYGNISSIAANPDSDREFVSITYQISRPLGR